MAPFLPQRQQLAIELEATEGTAETIVVGDVIAPVFEPVWTPSYEMDERAVVQPSLSRLKQIAGERSAVITWATEIKGSGTAGTVPPNLTKALQACGFAEVIVAVTSVTYKPASATVKSATIELREGSADTIVKIHQIVGARGTVIFELVKGQIFRARFTFTGRYIEPTEGSFFTQPAPGPDPEAALNAAFSFHGAGALKAQTITLDIANEVALRNDVNQVSGNFSALITGRTPTGNIDPEQEDIATINFFERLTDNTVGALSFVLGATAGNITTVTAPKAQITNVAPADRDAIRTEGIDLLLTQDTDAGDDELSIAFT